VCVCVCVRVRVLMRALATGTRERRVVAFDGSTPTRGRLGPEPSPPTSTARREALMKLRSKYFCAAAASDEVL